MNRTNSDRFLRRRFGDEPRICWRFKASGDTPFPAASLPIMADAFDRLKAALADRYAIERELGAGGMATVYLAHDQKHDRKVAIKVMRPELSAILGGERFTREIRIAAKLNHPHIMPLLDSGTAEEQPSARPPDRPSAFLYYVMPHVEGESLRNKISREKQLSVDEAISITKQVGAALDYAHERGVIHRDIKPENILIHQGEALVADFGIALAVTAAGGTRITETGLSLGTPEYMSPEQATGERELDARSDVYSLGAVLYELVAGQPPHTGATVQAVIAKKLAEPTLSLRVVRETVPEAMDLAVARALAKTPADRYVTAGEFCEALTGEDVAEVTPQRRRSDRIEWLVVLPPENHLGESAQQHVLAGMHIELISKINQIPGLNVMARHTALAYESANKTIVEIARELDVDAVVTCQALKTGGSVRISAQLIEAVPRERQTWEGVFTETSAEQLSLYSDVALAIADEIRATLTPEQRTRLESTRSVDPEAYDAYLRGTFQLLQLAGGYRTAVQHFQEAIGREPEWALPYTGLAQAHIMRGSWFGGLSADEALALAEPAVTRALELDESLAEAHAARGYAEYMLEWNWPGAESAFAKANDLGLAPTHSRLWYANFLTHMGRFEESIAVGERTLESDPLSPAVHNELGYALHMAGRYDEALQRYNAGLEVDPDFAQSHGLMMLLYLNTSRIDEALAVAERDVRESVDVLRALTFATVGRRVEALQILENWTRRSGVAGDRVSPYLLAWIRLGLGETEEVPELLMSAYEDHDPWLVTLKVHREWDPLRTDPRFQDLMRRMGFPE